MYEKNDKVLYATDGICTVDDIAERTYNGITELYYILTPMSKRGSKIMIPTSNELLVSRMRKLLTRDEVLLLIDHIPRKNGVEWICDDKQRREAYRSIIMRGERRELVGMIKVLYQHGERQKEIGKKLHAQDERFLGEAERMLYDEFSVVLGIAREEVLDYIRSRVESQTKEA